MASETATQETTLSKSASQLMAENAPRDGKKAYPFRTHAWICNITELSWPPIDFDFGRFAIRGKGEATEAAVLEFLRGEGLRDTEENRKIAIDEIEREPFAMTEITDRIAVLDTGDKKRQNVAIGALEIAHDICRQMNGNVGENGFVGLIVCEKPEPSKRELEEAHRRLREYCRHYCFVAEQEFSRHKNGLLIPDFARFAAKYLKLDVDFTVDTTDRMECPMCTAKVPSRAAICPNCKHELNPKLVAQLKAAQAGPQKTA